MLPIFFFFFFFFLLASLRFIDFSYSHRPEKRNEKNITKKEQVSTECLEAWVTLCIVNTWSEFLFSFL